MIIIDLQNLIEGGVNKQRGRGGKILLKFVDGQSIRDNRVLLSVGLIHMSYLLEIRIL